MPFANWSLLHNATSLTILGGSYFNVIPVCTAADIECANLILKYIMEIRFKRLSWPLILHHTCMFVPSAIIIAPRIFSLSDVISYHDTQQIASVILKSQIIHLPLLFRCMHAWARSTTSAPSPWRSWSRAFNWLYHGLWFPAVIYRNTVLFTYSYSALATPDRGGPFPMISLAIACSVLALDIYWTPASFVQGGHQLYNSLTKKG